MADSQLKAQFMHGSRADYEGKIILNEQFLKKSLDGILKDLGKGMEEIGVENQNIYWAYTKIKWLEEANNQNLKIIESRKVINEFFAQNTNREDFPSRPAKTKSNSDIKVNKFIVILSIALAVMTFIAIRSL